MKVIAIEYDHLVVAVRDFARQVETCKAGACDDDAREIGFGKINRHDPKIKGKKAEEVEWFAFAHQRGRNGRNGVGKR